MENWTNFQVCGFGTLNGALQYDLFPLIIRINKLLINIPKSFVSDSTRFVRSRRQLTFLSVHFSFRKLSCWVETCSYSNHGHFGSISSSFSWKLGKNLKPALAKKKQTRSGIKNNYSSLYFRKLLSNTIERFYLCSFGFVCFFFYFAKSTL